MQSDRINRRDPNVAGHLVLQRLHSAVQRLVRVDNILAVVIKQLPLFSQAEHLFAALDQQRIEMFLKRTDLLAHRRLGDSANTGRAGETATLRQVTKNLETLNLHKVG